MCLWARVERYVHASRARSKRTLKCVEKYPYCRDRTIVYRKPPYIRSASLAVVSEIHVNVFLAIPELVLCSRVSFDLVRNVRLDDGVKAFFAMQRTSLEHDKFCAKYDVNVISANILTFGRVRCTCKHIVVVHAIVNMLTCLSADNRCSLRNTVNIKTYTLCVCRRKTLKEIYDN